MDLTASPVMQLFWRSLIGRRVRARCLRDHCDGERLSLFFHHRHTTSASGSEFAIEGDWPYLWMDATYIKVRRDGRIVSVAVIIAVEVKL
jgi:hypothetical protein